jgi:signal transduction histidine kinase
MLTYLISHHHNLTVPFIWDRYYKSGKAHKRALLGTGLGLSIVKKVIELHSGSYSVSSEIGKGSTFCFEIPMIDHKILF